MFLKNNINRIESAGLIKTNIESQNDLFGRPKKSRLMLEKLLIGGAKITDVFKIESYQKGGVFAEADIKKVEMQMTGVSITKDQIENPQTKIFRNIKQISESQYFNLRFENDKLISIDLVKKT